MILNIAGKEFNSRLLMGTGKFSSNQVMRESVIAAQSEIVTVALKRVDIENASDDMLTALDIPGVTLLPNTSGARSAKEAIFAARLAREALGTEWLKLEIHPDPNYLMPDPIETYEAAKVLCNEGFIVLPYIHADPVLCKRLEDVGVAAVMPLAAPIGSNQGLTMRRMIEIIIEQSQVPVIVDAGLGAPSHAAAALEMGADAVLVNTAIAVSQDAVAMGKAFRMAVEAGRIAYQAKLAPQHKMAVASSPETLYASSH